jgi:signal transduction histidine kinase
MKLFTKYNRVNVLANVGTFIIGSIAFYFLLSYILKRQLDDTLRGEQQEITEYVMSYGKLPDFQNTRHQWITAEATTSASPKHCIKSFDVYDRREHEHESVRRLTFTITAGNTLYSVSVNRSETETEDLLQLIIVLTLCMIGLILALNYFINRRLVTHLWKPFYNTIDGIKHYFIGVEKPMELPKESIDEINLLNSSLNDMTSRIYKEYEALKSFTENASHEMQTPLAVIRSKIELLLQSERLEEKEVKFIMGIEDALRKLSKLHQSLILLTKLENRQFVSDEEVDLQKIIEDKVQELKELIQSKNIYLSAELTPVQVMLHHHLAEILINNLLNNALRYTPQSGSIHILLNDERLEISNTALKGPLDKENIFRRFYKSENGLDGTGLGLAIIKEISVLAGFDVVYSFRDQMHFFSIYLSKKA